MTILKTPNNTTLQEMEERPKQEQNVRCTLVTKFHQLFIEANIFIPETATDGSFKFNEGAKNRLDVMLDYSMREFNIRVDIRFRL